MIVTPSTSNNDKLEVIDHPELGEIGRIARSVRCVHLSIKEEGLITAFRAELLLGKKDSQLLDQIIHACAKDPEHIVDLETLAEIARCSERTLQRRLATFQQKGICLPNRKIRYSDGNNHTFFIFRVSDKSHTDQGRAVGPIQSQYLCTNLDITKYFKCDSFTHEVMVSVLRNNNKGKTRTINETQVIIANNIYPITVTSQSDDLILSVEDYRLVSVGIECIRQQIADMPLSERTHEKLQGKDWYIIEEDVLKGAGMKTGYEERQKCLRSFSRADGTKFDLSSIPKSRLMSLNYPTSGRRKGKLIRISMINDLKANLDAAVPYYSFKLNEFILQMLIANRGKSLHKEFTLGKLGSGIEYQIYLWSRRVIGHNFQTQSFSTTELRNMACPSTDIKSVSRTLDRLFKKRHCQPDMIPNERLKNKSMEFCGLPGCFFARHRADTDTLYAWADHNDELIATALRLEAQKIAGRIDKHKEDKKLDNRSQLPHQDSPDSVVSLLNKTIEVLPSS